MIYPAETSLRVTRVRNLLFPKRGLLWRRPSPLQVASMSNSSASALEITARHIRKSDAMTVGGQKSRTTDLPPAAFRVNIPVVPMPVSGSYPYRMRAWRRLQRPSAQPKGFPPPGGETPTQRAPAWGGGVAGSPGGRGGGAGYDLPGPAGTIPRAKNNKTKTKRFCGLFSSGCRRRGRAALCTTTNAMAPPLCSPRSIS